MLNEDTQGQIEKYLNNEMTEAEQTAFEKQIETDKNLAQTIQLYQDVAIQLTHATASIDLNNKLKNAQVTYKKANKSFSKLLKIGLFTIVIIALMSTIWWLTASQSTTRSTTEIPIASLWNDTEMPSANIIRNADVISNDTRLYQKAHIFFVENQFNQAIDLLDSIPVNSSIHPEKILLKGVCEYELGNYETAIQVYNTYLAIENAPEDMALWYQAIAYIQNTDSENAIKNLDLIIENAYSKAPQAQILLQQLK